MKNVPFRKFLFLVLILAFFAIDALAFPENLLFSKEDIPRIQENTQRPFLNPFWNSLLEADVQEDENFLREAFIYVVTGDEKRGRAAREFTLEMVRRDQWHRFQDADGTPIGLLRNAAKTANVALCYDWLYDLFTPEERREIRNAIADKGCQPMYNALYGMRHPGKVEGWSFVPDDPMEGRVPDMSRWPEILGHNNFRAVINGGLALGLFVVRDHDDRAETWESMLLDSVPLFNALFKDDGSYDEAVSYVNYAMKYQIHAMEVIKRKLGIDFFDTANFTGMMDFVLSMYLPSHTDRHGSISFGDAGSSLQSSTAFWVARNARDGLSQYVGLNFSEHYWPSFIYYDPSVKPQSPHPESHFVELDLDWIISRTGYDMDDFVLAMRSGEPMNHEHADRNSLLFKGYGEILLSDPGKVTYDPRSPEWILRTAQGHNMILIDGKGIDYHKGEEGTNKSQSSAKIVRSGRRQGYDFWASDATTAYQLVNPDVNSVTRSVIFLPQAPCLVVIDKVIKESTPSIISARWHLENSDEAGKIEIADDRSFTLFRPKARLHMYVEGGSDYTVKQNAFEFPDNPKKFRFADVLCRQPVQDAFLVTVATPLRHDEVNPSIDLDQSGETWHLSYNKNGSKIKLKLLDNGTLPEFEVLRNDFLN